MVKKIEVIFLSAVICLVTAASAIAMEYKEAPELRTKVAAGKLPSVEERLPEEPLVIEPVEEIGQYGGTWHNAVRGANDAGNLLGCMLVEHMIFWNLDFTKLEPGIAKDWKVSKDAKSIIFYLRKGMKWSDGAPLTADDFVFWWNDIASNKSLSPAIPRGLSIGGEMGKIEKIDDYTFKLSFIKPYGMFPQFLADNYPPAMRAPKHYLKQFHSKYTSTDRLKELMKKEGYGTWMDLFGAKNTPWDNPELPTIQAFYPLTGYDVPIQTYVRNPYYWKVDPEGNQLPYIDKVESIDVPAETVVLKSVAGDLDCQARGIIGLENYTLLMQYREKGNYRIIPSYKPQEYGANAAALSFNFAEKDPILYKLFNDRRFRVALSIAIDRNEINELFWKGLGTPSQFCPGPGTPWYEEKWEKRYAKYDPKHANQILDELGLKWDKDQGHRLRPDGKPLRWVVNTQIEYPHFYGTETAELIKKYWKKIGIEIVVKPVSTTFLYERMRAADWDMKSFYASAGASGWSPILRPELFPEYNPSSSPMGLHWGLWVDTNGQAGKEPPAEVKQLIKLREEIRGESSLEKRNELIKKAIEINSENLWIIGIVRPPIMNSYILAKNNFRNVPTKLFFWQVFNFSQCFIKK